MRQAHSPTFGNKTANIYVKKTYQFTTACKDDVMIAYQSSKTAKIVWVTLDGAMHMASLQAGFSW